MILRAGVLDGVRLVVAGAGPFGAAEAGSELRGKTVLT